MVVNCFNYFGVSLPELKGVREAFGSIRARSNAAFVARDEEKNGASVSRAEEFDGDGQSTEDDENSVPAATRPRKRIRPEPSRAPTWKTSANNCTAGMRYEELLLVQLVQHLKIF